MTDQQTEVDLSYIAEKLRAHAVPIDEPQSHPDNPRIGDVENIKVSIQRFGQVRPIMLQESTGYIVAGNHTRKAMVELGLSHVAAIPVDLNDEEALAYLIADNRLAELGGYDDAGQVAILEKLMLAGKLEGTGYTPDEVDDKLAAMDALPEVEPEPTEAAHGVTNEELAERFKNRSQAGPLRQFVVLYPQEVGKEVEGMLTRLARAWGMSGARDVILESLRRAAQDPPVEGLTAEEKERADAPPIPGQDPEPEATPQPDQTEDPVPAPSPTPSMPPASPRPTTGPVPTQPRPGTEAEPPLRDAHDEPTDDEIREMVRREAEQRAAAAGDGPEPGEPA